MGIKIIPQQEEPSFWESLGHLKGSSYSGIPQGGLASYQPAAVQPQALQLGPTGQAQAKDLERYIQNYYQNLSGQGNMQGLMSMVKAYEQPQQQIIGNGYQNPYVTGLMGAR